MNLDLIAMITMLVIMSLTFLGILLMLITMAWCEDPTKNN